MIFLKSRIYICCIFIFPQLLSSCDTSKGLPGVSRNIKDSKQNGSFCCELYIEPNPCIINDSISIYINEAWVERFWVYNGRYSKPDLRGGYVIRINSRDYDLMGYDDSWVIGNSFKESFRTGNSNNLIMDINYIPSNGRFEFNVNKGSYTYNRVGEKIGNFILKKK